MKKTASLMLLLLFAVVLSCTTKDGNILSSQAGSGNLLVTSNITGARVFIDNKDTGKTTPALIEDLPEGMHTVDLFLSNYKIDPASATIGVEAGEESNLEFSLTLSPAAGDLEINTTPDSALVLLDGKAFGYTPLTVLGLSSGSHTVKIIRGGYATVTKEVVVEDNQLTQMNETLSLKRHILVEHFSNTSCIPCPAADATIERVLKETGFDSVTSIAYHPNYPGPDDPMYLAAPEDNLARIDYYAAALPISLPVPYLVVDGIHRSISLNLEQNLRDAISARTQVSPPATLDVLDFMQLFDAYHNLSGKIKISAREDLTSDVVLRIVIIEKEKDFSEAPGTNGQTHFTDIMRDIFPSPDGVPVSLAAGQSKIVPFNFERQAEWGEDLHIVAFLQDENTNEVVQSVWTVIP